MSDSRSNSSKAHLIPLNLGIIAVQGEDAAKFLQGQVTCDVREFLDSQSDVQPIKLGGQCNVKGRLLLIFHAIQPKPDLILLFVNSKLVEVGLTNLRKYAVFFKVKLSDQSLEWRSFAVSGAEAPLVIKEVFGTSHLIDQHTQVEKTWRRAGEHLILNFFDNTYLIWISVNAPDVESVEAALHAATHPNKQSWQSHLIANGVPDIYPSTLELFTPQDLNLQLINGVNFRKGCYTGQEIVARLHYKAKLKRHLYRFELTASNELPVAGSILRDSQGKNLGEVVMAARRDSSSIELLASINDLGVSDAFIEGNLQKLRQLPLPYAIPSENEEPNA